jgi:hypothetical protein
VIGDADNNSKYGRAVEVGAGHLEIEVRAGRQQVVLKV